MSARPHYKDMMDGSAAERGDGSCVFAVRGVARGLLQRHGCCRSPANLRADQVPTPRKTLSDKLSLKRFWDLPIAKSYINCTEDTAMPHGEFAWHPRFSARLGLARIVQMPGGHEALFSNPELLAEKIIEGRARLSLTAHREPRSRGARRAPQASRHSWRAHIE